MNINNTKIIAVDDESDLDILFKHFFRKEIKSGKIDLDFALGAEQCLDQLKKMKTTDQVIVLTDINMPEVNGIELTKVINNKYPDIKVYLITAYDIDHISGLSEIIVNGIIHKPINFDDLKNTLSI